MNSLPPSQPVITEEVRIVDAQGHPRILLSAWDGVPTIVLLNPDGKPAMTARTDASGRPAVTLANPLASGPGVVLEIDDKGAHVKFDRPGGASAYLFLNNQGGSGTVLIDTEGRRRLQATVSVDGDAKIEQLGPDGKPLP
ncbi:hypothetical protein [Mesorhizobium sp. B2-4-17]|uniref:hypothetical protein n=1 Tax=Mesorhizobium sp. B2-4-17 TaxID=2589932 RepID=UPI00112956ED|nr:hypothetical protein [Mesorhizobium sp. B2-4-17]TPK78113.1 hypothetical protein FJ548_25255 [Mesorhizobium sp. B2-4-17]